MANKLFLLGLPDEIRNTIWRAALVEDKPIDMAFLKLRGLPELISTSKSVRSETLGIYYDDNTFLLEEDCHVAGSVQATYAGAQCPTPPPADSSSPVTGNESTAALRLAVIPGTHRKFIRKIRIAYNPILPVWWTPNYESFTLQGMIRLAGNDHKIWMEGWESTAKAVLQSIVDCGTSLDKLELAEAEESNTVKGYMQDTYKVVMEAAIREMMREGSAKA